MADVKVCKITASNLARVLSDLPNPYGYPVGMKLELPINSDQGIVFWTLENSETLKGLEWVLVEIVKEVKVKNRKLKQ